MNKMPKKSQKRRKTAFNLDIASFIVALFRTDFYSISEICRITNISRTTFYKWMTEYPTFRDDVEAAKAELLDEKRNGLKQKAKNALLRKISFSTITDTQVKTKPGYDENGNEINIVDHIITTTRTIEPDMKSIMFVLTNCEPEIWNKQYNNVEIITSQPIDTFKSMSDDELNELISKLRNGIVGCDS